MDIDENFDMNDYLGIPITESVDDVVDNIIRGVAKLIGKIKELISNGITTLKTTKRKLFIKSTIKKIRKKLVEEPNGTCLIVDYKAYVKEFNHYATLMKKRIKRLDDTRVYKEQKKMVKDIDKLDEQLKKTEEKLKEIKENPIRVSYADAIRFLEKEEAGKSKMLYEIENINGQVEKLHHRYSRAYLEMKNTTDDQLKREHLCKPLRKLSNILKSIRNFIISVITLGIVRFG